VPHPAILTITTDFGPRDAYVAAMKGVLLSRAPGCRIVDVTHEIAPQDVMQAAFVLRGVIPFFPEGTVHLVVVDPGVGTDRRPIAAVRDGQIFVGPDNGLFSLLFQGPPDHVVVLDRPEVWHAGDPSATFHGRDVFAPVAAALATGSTLEDVGSPTDHVARLHWALPISDDQGVRGWVVHVDHFGNCISNISREAFDAHRRGRRFKCYVGNAIIDSLSPTYGTVAPAEAVMLFNSMDLLEVAVFRGSASALLEIRPGAPLNIVFSDERA